MNKLHEYKIYYSMRDKDTEIDKHIVIIAEYRDEAISTFFKFCQANPRLSVYLIDYQTIVSANSHLTPEELNELYIKQNENLNRRINYEF